MPVAFEEDVAQATAIRSSAATELVWVLLWLQHGPPHRIPAPLEALLPFPAELVRRAETFWGDGSAVYSEAIVLAHAGGHLFDSDPERFLNALERGFPKLGELRLRSETETDRVIILERLRRLGADSQLRRDYVRLLRDAWAFVADTWRRDGLPSLEAGGAALAERLERAADPIEVLPKLDKADPRLAEMVRDELRRGEVVVCPCFVGGWWLVLDLPGLFLVATQVDPEWRGGNRRRLMEPIAAQLRVLADASRLAILTYLDDRPHNVTELMSLLELAQPTVSAHVRLLREAGLIRPERRGGRTDYVVDSGRLEDLLKTVSAALPCP